MIVGLGTDVLAVARMTAELRQGSGFRDAVFTPGEIAYCEAMRYPEMHYAARFATKEALFKAIGADGRAGRRWREVEVRREASGPPKSSCTDRCGSSPRASRSMPFRDPRPHRRTRVRNRGPGVPARAG